MRKVKTVKQVLEVLDLDVLSTIVNNARACDHAVDLMKENKYDEALSLLLPLVIQQEPFILDRAQSLAEECLDSLSFYHSKREEHLLALEYVKQLHLLSPKALYPMIRCGEIAFLELEDEDEAIKWYNLALEKYPKSIEALIGLANIYLYRSEHSEVEELLAKAWSILPNPDWSYSKNYEVVVNVIESLYQATTDFLLTTNEPLEWILTFLKDGIQRIGGHSEYLSEYLKKVENRVNNRGEL